MRSIEDIIVEKKYSELSPEELVMVSELAENEDEFNQMKQLFDNMSFGFSEADVFEANPETKSSLDSIFTAKHPVIANDWKKEEEVAQEVKVVPFYNQNWVRVAAVLLVFLGISVVYIQNSEEITPTTASQQAKAETPAETAGKSLNQEPESIDNKGITTTKEKEQLLATVNLPVQAERAPSDEISVYEDVAQIVAEDQAFGEQQSTGAFYTPPVASATSVEGNAYTFSTSAGLDSDLYPNGKADRTKKGNVSSGSTDVPASDMLDWIQAAY